MGGAPTTCDVVVVGGGVVGSATAAALAAATPAVRGVLVEAGPLVGNARGCSGCSLIGALHHVAAANEPSCAPDANE